MGFSTMGTATARVLAVGLALVLAGCTGTIGRAVIADAPAPGGATRALTAAERAVIARDVAAALHVTDGRLSFVWPRVLRAERSGVTDYCGFFRGRLPDGRYGEYFAFYAQLDKNRRGRADRAVLRLSGDSALRRVATREACEALGYDVSRPPAG